MNWSIACAAKTNSRPVAPAEEFSLGLAVLRSRVQIIAQTPTLRGAIERGSESTITALAGALVDRGANEIQARVAAAAVIAGLSTALLEWARSKHVRLNTALGSALDVLGGG